MYELKELGSYVDDVRGEEEWSRERANKYPGSNMMAPRATVLE